MQEITKGIIIKEEDENDVTTNLGVSSNKRFNTNLESNFNDNINSNKDINNKNI